MRCLQLQHPVRNTAAVLGYVGSGTLLGLTLVMAWLGTPYVFSVQFGDLNHRIELLFVDPRDILVGVAGLLLSRWIHRGFPTTARDIKGLVARSLLLLFSLSFAFGIGEVGCRLFMESARQSGSLAELKKLQEAGKKIPVRTTHPLGYIINVSSSTNLGYELQSSLDVVFGHQPTRTNKDGMRKDRDYPVERTPNSVRILGIGDSGMFGWDVPQGSNYMDVLEARLQARNDGIRYEALNLAVPGYNTMVESHCLREKGLKYRPDIVVVGWCVNDYQKPLFMMNPENFWRRDVSYVWNWLFNRRELSNIFGGFRVTDHRTLVADARQDRAARAEAGALESPEPESSVLAAVQDVEPAVRAIKEMSAQSGFKLLFFGPMDPQIVGLCKSLGVEYYNTLERIGKDEYPREKEFNVHFMHPGPSGHRVLAERLDRHLTELGWLKPATAAPAGN